MKVMKREVKKRQKRHNQKKSDEIRHNQSVKFTPILMPDTQSDT